MQKLSYSVDVSGFAHSWGHVESKFKCLNAYVFFFGRSWFWKLRSSIGFYIWFSKHVKMKFSVDVRDFLHSWELVESKFKGLNAYELFWQRSWFSKFSYSKGFYLCFSKRAKVQFSVDVRVFCVFHVLFKQNTKKKTAAFTLATCFFLNGLIVRTGFKRLKARARLMFLL